MQAKRGGLQYLFMQCLYGVDGGGVAAFAFYDSSVGCVLSLTITMPTASSVLWALLSL